MGSKRKVVGYNLETGERRMWGTMSACAETIGTSVSYILIVIKNDRPLKGWCLAYEEREQKAIDLYERGGQPRNKPTKRTPLRKPAKCNKGLVSLRIDSHTVIWVKPEDATEEYAEQYREMLYFGRKNS